MIIATILFIALVILAVYLTADWIVDEIKQSRANKRELEDWNASQPDERYGSYEASKRDQRKPE
jgi:hypothetical protein